jgi:hypothetical protein
MKLWVGAAERCAKPLDGPRGNAQVGNTREL